MAIPPPVDPPYDDITESVSFIGYGRTRQDMLWWMPKQTSVDQLREKCVYTLRDGSEVRGQLLSIRSCLTGPRVLIDLQNGGSEEYLVGTLHGSPLNLGVTLDDVINIQ